MVERPMPPILAFDKVSKRFGAVIVAQAIDLTVADGEALGIIGPNGAGKTTLFGIASGTVRPDAGRVVFAGSDITRLAPERRCRMGIGRSFQIPQPFNGMSVFENLVVAAAFGAGWPTRRTGRPAGSRCSIASGSNSHARWRPSRGCFFSTRWPAA
jgi:branched-chain amino acid transport system ATP-binding protein